MPDPIRPAARLEDAPPSQERRLRVLRAEELTEVLDAAVELALGEVLPEAGVQHLPALQAKVRREFARLLRLRGRGEPPVVLGELYERRIAKLCEALARAEAALAAGSHGDLGLASAYRLAQGLELEADQRELRLALLDEIYEANRRMLRI